MACSGATAVYLTTSPGRAAARPFSDEAREDVVDALARHAREARDLGRRGGVAPDERDVGLRLVLRETESDQVFGDRALVHGRSVPPSVVSANTGVGDSPRYAGEKSVSSGSRSPRRTPRSTSTQRRPRASASVRACSTTFCAARTPRTRAIPGSGRIRSR